MQFTSITLFTLVICGTHKVQGTIYETLCDGVQVICDNLIPDLSNLPCCGSRQISPSNPNLLELEDWLGEKSKTDFFIGDDDDISAENNYQSRTIQHQLSPLNDVNVQGSPNGLEQMYDYLPADPEPNTHEIQDIYGDNFSLFGNDNGVQQRESALEQEGEELLLTGLTNCAKWKGKCYQNHERIRDAALGCLVSVPLVKPRHCANQCCKRILK
eukprot:Pgem_evm1s9896